MDKSYQTTEPNMEFLRYVEQSCSLNTRGGILLLELIVRIIGDRDSRM